MTTDVRPTIAVSPAAALADRPRLFSTLERAFAVSFVAWEPSGARPAALVAFADGPSLPEPAELRAHGLPVLVVGGGQERTGRAAAVALGDVDGVDPRLRGMALYDALDGPALELREGETVLASDTSGVAWTRSRAEAAVVDRVRSTLPELAEDEVLYSRLGDRAIATVALVDLLRAAIGDASWSPAPLRATVVFDDPNLRRRRYGHIDYEKLLAHADQHGYHAVMAMIPLDAGRANRAAVELFARRADRLSLVFHGNDHSKRELLMPSDGQTALAMAAQAVRRVERFERRTGLSVDRVMMPPHGRCSEPMSRALGAVGFDALSAIHPLPWTEQWRSGPVLVGWQPADFVGGCPVIPRMPLSCSPSDIALRAYLDHPIILYGHHQDVADGLDLLEEAARHVNRLGDVQWISAGRIAETNQERRVVGDRMAVRPYSRRLRLSVDPSVCTLVVEAPDDALGTTELAGWSLADGQLRAFGSEARLETAGAPVAVRLHGAFDVAADAVTVPGWRPWPKLRRVVTEARDRATAVRVVSSPS